MRAHRVAVAAAVVALCATTTSCGSQTPSLSSAGQHHHHKAGVTHASRTGSPSSPASPSRRSSECTTADLRASLAGAQGTAGSTYVHLVLHNTSGSSCRTGGFSGVAYVGARGKQVGAPARRQGTPATLTLAPGASAAATLQESEAGNYPSTRCRPTHVRGLRVYPPNQTAALFVRQSGTGCLSKAVHLLTIQPLRATE